MVDPDRELRVEVGGGGDGVDLLALVFFPFCRFFFPFFTQNEGEGEGKGGGPLLDPPLS